MEENQVTTPPPEKNNTPFIVAAVVLILVLSVGAVFFLISRSSTQEKVSQEENDVNTQVTIPQADPGGGEEEPFVEGARGQVIDMQAGSFYFAPNEIRVKQGEKVTIVLKSEDMMHDFNIDELGVKIPITRAGETNTVEFVASEKGEFEFYCSVGQHRANGQVGKLIVE